MLGLDVSPIRSAASVSNLVAEAKTYAREHSPHCRTLVDALHRVIHELGEASNGARLKTANAACDLLEAVEATDDVELVRRLADCKAPTSTQAIGRSIKSAADVVTALDRTGWELFTQVAALPKSWGTQGGALRDRVVSAIAHDELAEALPGVLEHETRVANELILEVARGVTPPTPPRPPPPPETELEAHGSRTLSEGDAKPVLEELARRSEELDELNVNWRFKGK